MSANVKARQRCVAGSDPVKHEPHHAHAWTFGQQLNNNAIAWVKRILQNEPQRGVFGLREQQERLDDLGALVTRITGQRTFQRSEDVTPHLLWIATIAVVAGGCQFKVELVGQLHERGSCVWAVGVVGVFCRGRQRRNQVVLAEADNELTCVEKHLTVFADHGAAEGTRDTSPGVRQERLPVVGQPVNAGDQLLVPCHIAPECKRTESRRADRAVR